MNHHLPTISDIQYYTNWLMAAITALGLIVAALLKVYGNIRQQIGELQASHNANASRLDNTVAAVEQVKTQQINLALAIPPPATFHSLDVAAAPDVAAAVASPSSKETNK